MAIHYIVLGATDLNATATYNTAEDGSGSAPAAVADLTDVILSRGTQAAFTNVTALAAVNLTTFTIGPQFTGNFCGAGGTSISLLMTAGSPSLLTIESTGAKVCITSASTIEKAIVAQSGGGQVRFTGGTVSDLRISSGACFIDDAIVTAAYMTGGTCESSKLATVITTWVQTGGSMLNKRNITTASVDGPSTRFVNDGDAALTTANVTGKSFLNLRSTTATAVGTLNVHSGTVTPEYAKIAQVVTTINSYGASGVAKIITQWGTRTIVPGTHNDFGRSGTMSDSKGGGGSASFTP